MQTSINVEAGNPCEECVVIEKFRGGKFCFCKTFKEFILLYSILDKDEEEIAKTLENHTILLDLSTLPFYGKLLKMKLLGEI